MEMASPGVYEEEEDHYLEEEVDELIPEENYDYEYEEELLREMTFPRVYEDEEDLEEEVDGLITGEMTSPSVYEDEEAVGVIPEEIMSPARVYEDEEDYHLEGDIEGLIPMDGLLNNLNEHEGSPPGNQDNGSGGDDGGGGDGSGRNNDDVCPICFEAWTSGGDHQIWYDEANTCYAYAYALMILIQHSIHYKNVVKSRNI